MFLTTLFVREVRIRLTDNLSGFVCTRTGCFFTFVEHLVTPIQIDKVISRKLTLDEALHDGQFSLMTRQRIITLQRAWFEQLAALGF